MKKIFLLLLVFPFLFSDLKAQGDEREYGVAVFYTIGNNTWNIQVSINNIELFTMPNNSIFYQKIYSKGNALVQFRMGSGFYKYVNFILKNNDTVYYRINNTANGKFTAIEKSKNEALLEIENEINVEKEVYERFYSSERITYPYIPESFENRDKFGKRSGSGFLISNAGYVVTNYHVIQNTKKITVRGVNANKKSSLSAKIIYTDTVNDLAVLQLEDKISIEPPPFIFRNTPCETGENIFVLGYPLTTSMGEDIKLTDGLVSSANGYKGDTASYQISAPVQPGNSGGPLFDKDGNIVGIVNAKLTGAENTTYAIKIRYLQEALTKAGVTFASQNKNSLTGKPLTEQVKAIQNFVYIIDAE